MTTEEQNASRYPLAFDTNGNPIEVPSEAVAWRVRRGGGRRGRPRNVFDENGRQLEIPLGSTLENLIDSGCIADRYLLYAIDRGGNILPGAIAVTEIPEGDDAAEDEDGPKMSTVDPLVRDLISTLNRTTALAEKANDQLCRALEAAVSGYGPVRPAQLPQPVFVEQPAPAKDEGGFKPDQIAQYATVAKMVFDMIKGGAPAGESTPPMGGIA